VGPKWIHEIKHDSCRHIVRNQTAGASGIGVRGIKYGHDQGSADRQHNATSPSTTVIIRT